MGDLWLIAGQTVTAAAAFLLQTGVDLLSPSVVRKLVGKWIRRYWGSLR